MTDTTPTQAEGQDAHLARLQAQEDADWERMGPAMVAYDLAATRLLAGDAAAIDDLLHAAVKLGARADRALASRGEARLARVRLEETLGRMA